MPEGDGARVAIERMETHELCRRRRAEARDIDALDARAGRESRDRVAGDGGVAPQALEVGAIAAQVSSDA